jgi:uncharacterized metal-binding protein
MPSGKTHDALTLILAAPAFGVTYAVTLEVWISIVLTVGFLFGGLMFGPDLDTVSKQNSRWSVLRFVWFPYRTFFKHRSRWSHGLVFGTLIRVVYLMGVATCLAFVVAYAYSAYAGGRLPGMWEFARVWTTLRGSADALLGVNGVVFLFGGMWVGAASHTFTDLAGSYIKTGRRGGIF